MNFKLNKNVKNNKEDFEAFNNLSIKVFGLSLAKWYNDGYWGDNYCSYTLFDNDKAVANISASKNYTLVNGEPKLYIQLGNVSTDPDYRQRGLIRSLMKEVIDDFVEVCDGIYLYANHNVLDFYPKFGFKKETEYQYSKAIIPKECNLIKLDMDNDKDIKLLECYYNKNNPFSAYPMLKNFDLLMFYCGDSLKNNVYYLEEFQTVIIASFNNGSMLCYDIYCEEKYNINTILESAARKEINKVVLGFTPKNTIGYSYEATHNDAQLFVYGNGDSIFAQNKMMFPLTSHV